MLAKKNPFFESFIPLPAKISATHAANDRQRPSCDALHLANADSCRGTIHRALFVPNESIKLFGLNAFSVHVPSQLEWN
jgi:hypothetical protein